MLLLVHKGWRFMWDKGPRQAVRAVWAACRHRLRRSGQRLVPCPPVAEPQAAAVISPQALRVVAFYLPQFHPIPENDRWWGEGFTEWHNVARARPLFPGHAQPDLPGALGFYDLRLPEVLRRQVDLAKHHGLSGFCFHYYWFSGSRLLEGPLDAFLADKGCDLPFCLNWANENWTRRWDGQERDVLMRQRHTPEDDRAMMADLLRYFADPRYIRLDGRPVLLVYHAALLPDMSATIARWREVCAAVGERPPFCVMVQSFANEDPRTSGFDAAVQFPPHAPHLPLGLPQGRVSKFSGKAVAYEELARQMLVALDGRFSVFPCVCPGWDNTPRRGSKATVFVGANPERYAAWLEAACRHVQTTLPAEQRLVFVNAWNEWGEGAHLEPCRNWGYGFLNATGRVLAAVNRRKSPNLQ